MGDNKIYWVKGNTQELLIPLEQEIMPDGGEVQNVPYYPTEGATVKVCLVGKYKKYTYTPIVDGNLLRFTEEGTIPAGCYGVEVIVDNPDGTRYRSLWCNQIVVTTQNDSVLQEWDEFKEQEVEARAAIFFFAKGDKGEPFTYEDFTNEQIEELQRPATEAAVVAQEKAELAEQKAEVANAAADNADNAASLANEKAGYAQQQGDYAKQKADEIEEAKGSYQNLDARLDAMEEDTSDRFERITQSQFNEIFT